MSNNANQLAHLRNLATAYKAIASQTGPYRAPPRHIAGLSKCEARELLTESVSRDRESEPYVRQMLVALLKSGFPAPDDWLTVRIAGKKSMGHEAASPNLWTFTDGGADINHLKNVIRDMDAQIIRIEATGTPAARSLTVKEVTDLRGVDAGTVRRWCEKNKNDPDVSRSGREWRIAPAALDRTSWPTRDTNKTKRRHSLSEAATFECIECGNTVTSRRVPTFCSKCNRSRKFTRTMAHVAHAVTRP